MRDAPKALLIAGLLTDDFTDTSHNCPWIGDVPVWRVVPQRKTTASQTER